MNITIRKAVPADSEFLRKAFHEEKPIIHTFRDEYVWDTFAHFLFEHEGLSEVLVAENDGERAGFQITISRVSRFWQLFILKLGYGYVIRQAIVAKFRKKNPPSPAADAGPIDPEFSKLFAQWLKDVPGHAKIIYLYIRPESRGNGTVEVLNTRTEETIRGQGFSTIDGILQHGNKRSYNFATRHGSNVRNAGSCYYSCKPLR